MLSFDNRGMYKNAKLNIKGSYKSTLLIYTSLLTVDKDDFLKGFAFISKAKPGSATAEPQAAMLPKPFRKHIKY